jgi:probable F420-dependent oxidoreductase
MPGDASSPLPDPLVWLSYVASATARIRLATGVLILPQRNPLVLAKEVATLDHLSGGRVVLGVGVGWLAEEFDALGVPFRRRGARADEYIEVMRRLWDGDHAAHDGEFVSFSDVSSNPKPARGRVPIVVGGHSEAAARRAGRIGDGFFPGTGDLPVLFDIVRQTAADAGRDPSAIELTAGHAAMRDDPAAAVEELTSLGVSRAVVPAFFFSRGDLAANLAEFGEQVIQPSA